MRCQQCGTDNPGDFIFCQECGQKLVQQFICPHCGHPSPPTATFCMNCGYNLHSQGVGPRFPVQAPAAQPQTQVVILRKREKRGMPGWIWALAGIAGSMAVMLVLVWFNVFDIPGSIIDRLPESVAGFARTLNAQGEGPPILGVVFRPSVADSNREIVSGSDGSDQASAPSPDQGSDPGSAPDADQGADQDTSVPDPPQDSEPVYVQSSDWDEQALVYGLTYATIKDTDQDYLPDSFEKWAMEAFYPYLKFDEDEDVDVRTEMMRFYQVSPLNRFTTQYYNGPYGILLTFVMAYERDTGDALFGIHDHWGDTEAVRILIAPSPSQPNVWYPQAILVKRHYDPWKGYYPSQLQWERSSNPPGLHPVLWVSEDKHATYISWDECEDYGPIDFEFCGGGVVIDDPILDGVDGFNVGELDDHPFDKIPANQLNLFRSEYAWDEDKNFCGGKTGVNRDDCAGSLRGKWWPAYSETEDEEWREQGKVLTEYAGRYYVYLFGGHYQLDIYTGDVHYAGTDLNLDITFEGKYSTITVTDIDDPNRDDFERGNVDRFFVGPRDVGGVLGLTVHVYDEPNHSSSDSEWYLEKIVVKNLRTGTQATYMCECWLDSRERADSEAKARTHPTMYLSPDSDEFP